MPIQRAAINEFLSHLPPATAGAIRVLPSVQAIVIALDQVCNRVHEAVCRTGSIDAETARRNEADIRHAVGNVETLEAALKASIGMIRHVAAQLASGDLSATTALGQYGITESPPPVGQAVPSIEPEAPAVHADQVSQAEDNLPGGGEPEPEIPTDGFPEDDAVKRRGKKGG